MIGNRLYMTLGKIVAFIVASIVLFSLPILMLVIPLHSGEYEKLVGMTAGVFVGLVGLYFSLFNRSGDPSLKLSWLVPVVLSALMHIPVWMIALNKSHDTLTQPLHELVFIKGDSVHIAAGGYDHKVAWALKAALMDAECDGDLKNVVVTGFGGASNVADYMVSQLKNCGVDSVLATGRVCDSSCTGIWSQFPVRRIDTETLMGFHRAISIVGETVEPLLRWYGGIFPHSVLKQIVQVPSSNVCRLSAKTMVGLGMYQDSSLNPQPAKLNPQTFNDFILICNRDTPKSMQVALHK